MSVLIIIFMIVAIIFAISSLGYVAVDVTLEVTGVLSAKKASAPAPAATPPAPVVIEVPIKVEPEIVVSEPEPVEQIDSEAADDLMSDAAAMRSANYEKGAGHGKQGIINIGVINDRFDADDVITIDLLKQKGLVPKNIGRIKVVAGGVLSKPFTIKAESYSAQAIKMIELMGGKVIILKD